MYRALIGRMKVFLRRLRKVNTTKIQRTVPALPIPMKRSSSFECRGSGNTAMSPRKSDSISASETPCFRHLERLPSSQSKPAIRIQGLFLYQDVPLYSHSSTPARQPSFSRILHAKGPSGDLVAVPYPRGRGYKQPVWHRSRFRKT